MIMAAVGLGACTFARTEPPPGDLTAFDAFQAIPKIGEFAGPGARLLKVEARHVRATGTQDLTAKYVGTSERAVGYSFLLPTNAKVDESAPVGARREVRSFEQVDVDVYQPHWRTIRSSDGKGCSSQKHEGMMRSVSSWSEAQPENVARQPACSLARLWKAARQHGAPGNAVATITYDRAGYTFRIPGTKVDLRFGHDCKRAP